MVTRFDQICIHYATINIALHFGSYNPGKLRGTLHKGRNSAVKSSPLTWAGQYKKCVQYNFILLKVNNKHQVVKKYAFKNATFWRKFKFLPINLLEGEGPAWLYNNLDILHNYGPKVIFCYIWFECLGCWLH